MPMSRRAFAKSIAGAITAATLAVHPLHAQESTPSASPVASPVANAASMLPTIGPEGLDQIEDSWDTLDTVAKMLEGVTTRDAIADTGYIGGATRIWTSVDGETIPEGSLILLEISIHAFSTADGAATALPYIGEAFELGGLQPVEHPVPFGDLALTFAVTDPATNLGIGQVLIQSDVALYQVQGRVINGDPLALLDSWLAALQPA